MTKYYKATDKDGRVHLRSTADRFYSHAVVWRGYASWAGSLTLAHKQASRAGDIIEAQEVSGSEFRALKKHAVMPAEAARS